MRTFNITTLNSTYTITEDNSGVRKIVGVSGASARRNDVKHFIENDPIVQTPIEIDRVMHMDTWHTSKVKQIHEDF